MTEKPVHKRPKGRPETRIIKLDVTPEQAARAIFSAVKKPDPSLRMGRGKDTARPKG